MSVDPATPELPDGFAAEMTAAWTDDARWRVVSRYFKLKPVDSNHDIRPGRLYFVHTDEGHILRSGGEANNVDPVPMTIVMSGEPINPVSRRAMFEMGRKAQLFVLSPRANLPPPVEPKPVEAEPDATTSAADPTAATGAPDTDDADKPTKAYLDGMLDMGSFTQLLTVAQHSGIVPLADHIAHVRDCEFRMGQYQTAFDTIDRLYVGFKQAADLRTQQLRRDEIDYKSGVLKMTAKEWMKKKQRDTLQTNLIERARRNFVRVLDGLRVLVLAQL